MLYKRLILTNNCSQNCMKKKKNYALQINAKCMFFPNDFLRNTFYVGHKLTQFPKSKPIHHNIKTKVIFKIQILKRETKNLTSGSGCI